MKAISPRRRKAALFVVSSFLFLLLLLSACGGGGNNTPTRSSTPTLPVTKGATPSITTTGTANTSATPINVPTAGSDALTPSPGVRLGAQPCPTGVKDPGAWVSILQPAQELLFVDSVQLLPVPQILLDQPVNLRQLRFSHRAQCLPQLEDLRACQPVEDP